MTKVSVVSLLFVVSVFISACGSAESNSNANVNANANQTAGVGNVNLDPNNLPEGLSTSPIPPSSNSTPGIPAPGQANSVPKGATPTPGIPSPDELKKPFKPGATPTPGIPDPETLRKQLQRPSNVNVNAPTGSDTMMMKGRKEPRPVNRPQ